MVALATYLDESQIGDVFVVAGYLGVVEQWDTTFAPAWQRAILDDAPRPIKEFKTSDCRHQTSEFEGWSKEECDALTTRCVDLITCQRLTPDIIGVGVAIVGSTAKEVAPGAKDGVDLVPYLHCMTFMKMLMNILSLSEQHLGSDKVRIVCDKQKKREGRLKATFDAVMEEYPSLQRSVGPPLFKHSDVTIPLQAADLLAYETCKEMRNRREIPPRKISCALDRLTKERLHVAHYMDENVLKEAHERRHESEGMMTFPTIYDSDGVVR